MGIAPEIAEGLVDPILQASLPMVQGKSRHFCDTNNDPDPEQTPLISLGEDRLQQLVLRSVMFVKSHISALLKHLQACGPRSLLPFLLLEKRTALNTRMEPCRNGALPEGSYLAV